jgi:hypothetical protein
MKATIGDTNNLNYYFPNKNDYKNFWKQESTWDFDGQETELRSKCSLKLLPLNKINLPNWCNEPPVALLGGGGTFRR